MMVYMENFRAPGEYWFGIRNLRILPQNNNRRPYMNWERPICRNFRVSPFPERHSEGALKLNKGHSWHPSWDIWEPPRCQDRHKNEQVQCCTSNEGLIRVSITIITMNGADESGSRFLEDFQQVPPLILRSPLVQCKGAGAPFFHEIYPRTF